jgi:hypothetical protein
MDYIENDLKIEDIELKLNIKPHIDTTEPSALEKWYTSISKKSLSELSDGDVARFIRQDLFLEYIIPEALRRVSLNPLAGGQYNGEIVSSLEKVSFSFWDMEPKLKNKVIILLNLVIEQCKASEIMGWTYEDEASEFIRKAQSFLCKLENS